MTSIIKVDTLQKANGATPTAADLGINVAGNVLQTVTHLTDDQTLTTSTTWADVSGSSVSFTPKFANSKIIFSYTPTYYVGQGWASVKIRLMDGTTNLMIGNDVFGFRKDMQANRTQYLYEYVSGRFEVVFNSWGTTAHTLKLQIQESNGQGQQSGVNSQGGEQYIVIQEIAG